MRMGKAIGMADAPVATVDGPYREGYAETGRQPHRVREVIRRFGRHPHRNPLYGGLSSPRKRPVSPRATSPMCDRSERPPPERHKIRQRILTDLSTNRPRGPFNAISPPRENPFNGFSPDFSKKSAPFQPIPPITRARASPST